MGSGASDTAWRQGSLLGEYDLALLMEVGALPDEWSQDDLLVVVSHSCDVARNADLEPTIEIARAVAVDSVDGNNTFGKSSRVFDVDDLVSGQPFRFKIADRLVISRSQITVPSGHLGKKATEDLARWISRRYRRSAFPDEFNRRLQSKKSKIRRKLAKDGRELSLLLVWLYTDDELDDGGAYEVEIIGTLGAANYKVSQTRERCVELLDAVADLFAACAGIEVLDHRLASEEEVSIADLDFFVPLDVEDLSVRDDEAALGPDP